MHPYDLHYFLGPSAQMIFKCLLILLLRVTLVLNLVPQLAALLVYCDYTRLSRNIEAQMKAGTGIATSKVSVFFFRLPDYSVTWYFGFSATLCLYLNFISFLYNSHQIKNCIPIRVRPQYSAPVIQPHHQLALL